MLLLGVRLIMIEIVCKLCNTKFVITLIYGEQYDYKG